MVFSCESATHIFGKAPHHIRGNKKKKKKGFRVVLNNQIDSLGINMISVKGLRPANQKDNWKMNEERKRALQILVKHLILKKILVKHDRESTEEKATNFK